MALSDYNINAEIDSITLNEIISEVNTQLLYTGQSTLPLVQSGDLVQASEWARLYNKLTLLANHLGAGYTQLTTPQVGDRAAYNYSLISNLNNVVAAKGNASSQGASVSTSANNSGRWYNTSVHTHTVNFVSGDAAKNFFNAGGQLSFTFSHPNGIGINNLFYSIAVNMGTLIMSAPRNGSVLIAGSSYKGLTAYGSAGPSAVFLPTSGYYGLTTTDTLIYKKLGPYTYASSFGNYGLSHVSVTARTNGTQGSNGDNGSSLFFTTTWDQIPNGIGTAPGTNVVLTVKYPSSTYITNTWGTVNVTGIVSSS